MEFLESLNFGTDGLLPAIVQDAGTGEVLMLAFMNREALQRTLETGKSHFWSRSRQALWRKGESSGHEQTVVEIRLDCDGDALLLVVEQEGVACHTGARSCFHRALKDDETVEADAAISFPLRDRSTILQWVHDVIAHRKRNPRQASYTCELLSAGQGRILKKIGEEAAEVLIAAMEEGKKQIVHEVADLLYHLLVLLVFQDIPLSAVYDELADRRRSDACTTGKIQQKVRPCGATTRDALTTKPETTTLNDDSLDPP